MAPARHGPARAALRATGSVAADRLPRRHRRHSGKSARHGQHHDPAADNHPTDAPSCSLFSPACWRFSPEHGSAQTSALRDRPASTHPLPGWRTYRTWRLATSGDQPQAPPPPGKRTAQPVPVAQATRRVLLASISASSATWRLSLSCQAPFTITDSARCCRWVNARGPVDLIVGEAARVMQVRPQPDCATRRSRRPRYPYRWSPGSAGYHQSAHRASDSGTPPRRAPPAVASGGDPPGWQTGSWRH